MPLPRSLARFNRQVTNKVLGPLALVMPPFAIVVHWGRKSRHEHRTPVWAFRTEHGFVIALTYGRSRTEWLRNVLVEGRAILITRQHRYEVARPRVLHGEDGIRRMPPLFRPVLRALRVDDFLLLDSQEGVDASQH